MSPPGLLGAALVLARKDLVLEARSRELTLALGLFGLAALVLFHYAVGGDAASDSPRVAGGLLWVAILLASLLALNRAFAAERDEGLLDALLLAPVDRTAIWLSKTVVVCALLAAAELVLVPLFWLFFLSGANAPAPGLGTLLLVLVLADVGLACTGALVASLASAVRQREVLLPVLFLPVAMPLLIAATAATIASAEGSDVSRYVGLLGLYDVLFAVLAWGAYDHVITE